MKKVLISAFALFLMTASTEQARAITNEPSFDYAVYTTADRQLQVILEKQPGAKVRIEIVNSNGETLAREYVRKNHISYRGLFNVDELKDGVYSVVITDGKSVETRKISLITSRPVAPVKNIQVVN